MNGKCQYSMMVGFRGPHDTRVKNRTCRLPATEAIGKKHYCQKHAEEVWSIVAMNKKVKPGDRP